VLSLKERRSEIVSKAIPITMNIPAASEFVGVVRLAVSGIATRMNFPIADIEDIKIAISEACTNCVQHAYEEPEKGQIHITCNMYDTELEILVEDYGKGFDADQLPQGPREVPDHPPSSDPNAEKIGLGLGVMFIKSLMDDADIQSEKGKGTQVRMVKRLPAKQN